MTGWRAWWNFRSVREKRMLLAMGGLAAIVLAWLLIIRPIDNTLAAAKARHDRAVIALGQIEARAVQIERLRAISRPVRQGRIADIVGAEAVRVGFTMNQTEPAGTDGVRLLISAVRPQSFFAWIADLESRLGLRVETLTARPNADQTLSVEVTLREGAR